MNKTQLIAAIATLTAGTTVVALYIHRLNKDVYARFPEYSHKDLRKAYRMFLLKAAGGEMGDFQNFTDEQMDELFLKHCLIPVTTR